MDIEIIRELAKIMSEQKLSKIDITDEATHIYLESSNNSVVEFANAPQNAPVVTPSITITAEQKSTSSSGKNVYEQKSPIVGTLYLSPDSNTAPLVSVGGKVKKGDTVCVIESMKILNDIAAEADGTIIEICARNEQIVDFGQKLFVIELN